MNQAGQFMSPSVPWVCGGEGADRQTGQERRREGGPGFSSAAELAASLYALHQLKHQASRTTVEGQAS